MEVLFGVERRQKIAVLNNVTPAEHFRQVPFSNYNWLRRLAEPESTDTRGEQGPALRRSSGALRFGERDSRYGSLDALGTPGF